MPDEQTIGRQGQAVSSPGLLFAVGFVAIAATSFCFILRALVVGDWGAEFALTETQKGELLGAGLWPFAITIVLLSLVVDRIGFKAAFALAFVCHVVGLGLLVAADGYWTLYAGTFVMALGNGAVEAAANPLVATVFHKDKPRWLNLLHAAWPGGMMAGGLLAMGLGGEDWRLKVALMAIPVAAYGVLLLRARFPASERVASGVPYRAMLAEAGWVSALVIISLMMLEIGRVMALPLPVTLALIAILTGAYAAYARSAGRPLYVLLVLLMIPLAITELSTDSWITALMEPEMRALGLQAGWVLVYTALVVFVVRLFAGPVIRLLNPLGALAMASAAAAAGIFMLAGASGPALLAAATLYGIGKSFFWGTTIAVASEQFPRGGALTMNIIGGTGMLAAGVIGSVLLGAAQDAAAVRALEARDAASGSRLVQTYVIEREAALGTYRALDPARVAAAPASERPALQAAVEGAKKVALRDLALLPVLTFVAFVALSAWFRKRGGYRPVALVPDLTRT